MGDVHVMPQLMNPIHATVDTFQNNTNLFHPRRFVLNAVPAVFLDMPSLLLRLYVQTTPQHIVLT